MMFVTTLFFATAFADTETVVVEAWPTYEMDTTAYVGAARVRLRADSDLESEALGILPMTAPVTVIEDGEEWVHVRTDNGLEGYVSRPLLTAGVLEYDLGDDGIADKIVATFDAEQNLVLRVLEGDKITRSRLEGVDMHYVTLSVLDRWEAGVPMIRVETPDREACGESQHRHFFSYQNGKLRAAISEYEFSDVPYYSRESVQFLPSSQTAIRTSVSGDYDEGDHRVEVDILEFRDGVYVSRAQADLELITAPW